MKVSDIFEVRYGVNLELNALKLDPNGVNFVARSSRNNGVTAKVKRLKNITPLPAGSITVAGGGSVMESFLQPEPYYSGRDLYYLVPKIPLTDTQKLFYCSALRANRYRYNYGRQANRTLKDILIPNPESIPTWTASCSPSQFDGADAAFLTKKRDSIWSLQTKLVALSELFEIRNGNGLELNRLTEVPSVAGIPFVSRKSGGNGIAAYVQRIPGIEPNPAMELTVALSGVGGLLSTFLQEEPYYTAFHVACLSPKHRFTRPQLLYFATCIVGNRFRYGFGRQANRTLGSVRVPIPQNQRGWKVVDEFMLSLPFSSQVLP